LAVEYKIGKKLQGRAKLPIYYYPTIVYITIYRRTITYMTMATARKMAYERERIQTDVKRANGSPESLRRKIACIGGVFATTLSRELDKVDTEISRMGRRIHRRAAIRPASLARVDHLLPPCVQSQEKSDK